MADPWALSTGRKGKDKDKAPKTKENLSRVAQPVSDKAEIWTVEPTATEKFTPQAFAGSYCVLATVLFWVHGNSD